MHFRSIALLALLCGCATPNKYVPGPDGGDEPDADTGALKPDAPVSAPDAPAPDAPSSVPTDAAAQMDLPAAPDAPVPQDGPAAPVDERPPGDVNVPPDKPPAVCGVDERKCDGDTAMKCRADRSGFEVAEVCSGRVPYCYQGQCTGCGGGKGVCGDGLCPAGCPNETASACFGDCGVLPEGEVRTGGTGIIPHDNLWGECGPYQALIAVFSGNDIRVTCTADRAAYGHRASDCRTVDYAEDPNTVNEFVSTCRDDELIAAFGKHAPGEYLCCKADVHHKDCQRQASCRVDQYAADVIASEAVTGSVMLWCCSP